MKKVRLPFSLIVHRFIPAPPADLGGGTLPGHYARLLAERAAVLLPISRYVAADAYFSKKGFTDSVSAAGLELISRLRDDGDLLYIYKGPRGKGRGRPKKYDGKILYGDLREEHFTCTASGGEHKAYHGTLYSRSLKRKINLVVAKKKGKWSHKLYISTDLGLSAEEILEYYRARFQIEFIFRDAKQHTGLDHCQARSPEKLHFHWNASLTSVNMAKAAHWACVPKEGACSQWRTSRPCTTTGYCPIDF